MRALGVPAGAGLALVLVLSPALAGEQCRPGENSNEAKLLAHYSAPITFAPQTCPSFARGHIVLASRESPLAMWATR